MCLHPSCGARRAPVGAHLRPPRPLGAETAVSGTRDRTAAPRSPRRASLPPQTRSGRESRTAQPSEAHLLELNRALATRPFRCDERPLGCALQVFLDAPDCGSMKRLVEVEELLAVEAHPRGFNPI